LKIFFSKKNYFCENRRQALKKWQRFDKKVNKILICLRIW